MAKIILTADLYDNVLTEEPGDYRSSRKLVGIAIQHSDSEQEELFVHDSM